MVTLAALLATSTLFCALARAQASYPDKPIRFVVPFTPAGSVDIIARVVGRKLEARFGVPVIVDNRTGAGGTIGTEAVAKAAPDGYTFVEGTQATHAANKALYQVLRYDPVGDFEPVHGLIAMSGIFAVRGESPFKTLKDFVDHAKTRPGQLSFSSGGVGTGGHLMNEQFQNVAGIKLMHVPYKGSAPAVADIVGGQIDAGLDFSSVMGEFIRAGRLRPLATTGQQRLGMFPDVPTFAEAGYPAATATAWVALFAPAKTPPAIVGKVQRAVADIAQSADGKKTIAEMGGVPLMLGGAELKSFVAAEGARWRDIVQKSSASAQ
ncbi:Bug family tripartite tricarboxylate transporter substrate binding protein [Xylophilus sp.]|uniref:Bug family tripartite tricarboxylate transporter substrate binding protein n=1 Tax=Xylophilus sp. TaxID=2653893 RepID=UPI002D80BED7|nr:tripartite tricarboxylate transporter substrate binding protein [Xylophilus sp.]